MAAPAAGSSRFERALTDAILGAERAFRRAGSVSGLTTGLRDLDSKMGGMHPSDLLILAGRPGMGKTALATKIAFGAAKALLAEARADRPERRRPRQTVAIFSLEMSAEQLATRLLSEEARISGDRIRRGDIGQKDFDKFVQVSREISSLPIQIDDTPAITMSALRTRCRRLKRTKGLALVIVDYLQLMRPAAGTKPENRVLEISMITQGLKALAKELADPGDRIVAACPARWKTATTSARNCPTCANPARSSRMPTRSCSSIATNTTWSRRCPRRSRFDGNGEKFNAAMDEWQQRMAKAHNRADLIIAKQRHGPTGSIPLLFEGEFTRFGDIDLVHSEYVD